MKVNNVEIEFIKGDITELKADAIVNPANTELKMGGGVSFAIIKKGGRIIEREASKYAPIGLGESVITSGGDLKTRLVIHVATMKMDFKTDQHIIRTSANSVLKLAKEKKLKTIAMPALGCGTGRFAVEDAAKIMAEESAAHILKGTTLHKIIFILHTYKDHKAFKDSFLSYCGYFLRKNSDLPVPTVDGIIIMPKDKILLIKRKNPPYGWALPGGFLEYGESLEECLIREIKEETSLLVTGIEQFHTYSNPDRDPRLHTVSTVFVVKTQGSPQAKSDALSVGIFELAKLPPKKELAFDHWQIIQDWLKKSRE